MSADPAFASTPFASQAQIGTANTNRDGTGTIGTVLDATGAGILRRVDIVGVGTVTGGMIRLFLSLDGGTTKRLLREVAVVATTPSATVEGFQRTVYLDDYPMPDTNFILYAATHNAETFNVFAAGGYF